MAQSSSTHQPGTRLGRVPVSTRATPARIEQLRRIGEGSLSDGLVRALDAWELLHRAGVALNASTPPPRAI
jgi:hypothetical protein